MINNIINWIIENREWFFSGIGVTILLGIIAIFRNMFTKKSERKKDINIQQKNKGQNNTQIGIQNNYYGGTEDDR